MTIKNLIHALLECDDISAELMISINEKEFANFKLVNYTGDKDNYILEVIV